MKVLLDLGSLVTFKFSGAAPLWIHVLPKGWPALWGRQKGILYEFFGLGPVLLVMWLPKEHG